MLTLNTSDLNRDGATDLIASWGAVLLNVEADANWAPTVDAGPDQQLDDTSRDASFEARAVDDDQDMLTWTWTTRAGHVIARWPKVCVNGLTDGRPRFTVTVDDGHGHQTSDTVTVTVGEPRRTGTTEPVDHAACPGRRRDHPVGRRRTPSSSTSRIPPRRSTMVDRLLLDDGATWSHIWECHYTGQPSGPGVPDSRDEACTGKSGTGIDAGLICVFAQDDDGWPDRVRQRRCTVTIAPQPGGVPLSVAALRTSARIAKAGSTTYSNGVFTVNGSGADIWDKCG